MYGNLYDPSSPLADENGFRKDYIDAMRELKITNMRWPGGNFTAGYNWQDGIGPKEERPVRKDLAWGGIENNHVGTDEWVLLNRAIGSENVVCVNLGMGNINDARYWVEYCNFERGASWSDLRIKYGNREPYNVKYWCLGNEVDGSPWIMGYRNAGDYCKIAIEAAKAMRAILAVAMYLNSFIRHADIVKMANYTLMTSLPGNDLDKGTFKTPLFLTFKSFSNNCIGNSIDVFVECDTFNTERFRAARVNLPGKPKLK